MLIFNYLDKWGLPKIYVELGWQLKNKNIFVPIPLPNAGMVLNSRYPYTFN